MEQGIAKIIEIVGVTVHPENAVSLDLSEPGLKMLLDSASSEIEFIKKYLIVYLFNPRRKSEYASLIQNYQSLIIKLLDDLFAYQQQTENRELIHLYSSLINSVGDLLSYIKTYFSPHFNLDAKIPDNEYSYLTKEFEQQLSELKVRFEGRSEDLQLIEIVGSHYQFFEQGLNKKSFTYRDLVYKKELFRQLNDVATNTSIHKSVKQLLLYLNFNHIRFFKYLIDQLQEEYNILETLEAKLDVLKYHRKQFRQMLDQFSYVLFSDLIPMKDQVLHWIEEEIFFMERQIKPQEYSPEKNVEQVAETKINVALSVAQLAVLVRVLTLGKVITNNNQMEVIKIFASNFRTYRAEDISYGSLYGKYYKAEASAIKGVRGILLELVTLTTKM